MIQELESLQKKYSVHKCMVTAVQFQVSGLIEQVGSMIRWIPHTHIIHQLISTDTCLLANLYQFIGDYNQIIASMQMNAYELVFIG